MNRIRSTLFACGLALSCAIGITGLVLARRWSTRQNRRASIEQVSDWQQYSRVGHRIGPSTAPVTITAFSDFQCPFCRRTFATLERVHHDHPTDVSVVYRHFPLLRAHHFAFAAALASECADASGRFESYSRELFRSQKDLRQQPWVALAARIGVPDTASFGRCLRDSTFASTVRADIDAGRRLRVTGTPTILVNGLRLHAVPTAEELEDLIRNQLRAAAAR